MQEKERFERYTPQYPLPSDISNMSRQDTVCQFCGVSYLIHNEIKALESKCQKLEADLTYYAGITSREAALERLLQTERTRVADLESTVNMNTHKLNEMTRKLQLANDECQQSENLYRETKLSYSRCSTNIRAIHNQIETIRKEHLSLKDFYSKDIQNWKTFFQTTQKSIHKEIQTLSDQHSKQLMNYQTEIKHSQHQLNETNQSLRDLQMKYHQSQESQTKIQNDLQSVHHQTQIDQTELLHLREQLTQAKHINLDLEKSKDHSRQLFDQTHRELSHEKQLRLGMESDLENLRLNHSQLLTECDQLKSKKTELEMSESLNRKKLDETNRSRQAVLDRTRDEYEKLLQKYNELDEVYQEIITIREKDSLESEKIRRELARFHDENIELTKQKDTLIITHDIQMKKLHETYSNKLREAEHWPDRLQTELKQQREQHRQQLIELEQRLTNNFTTELNIEKQKNNNLLRKYEQDTDHSTQKLRHELISTEKVTIEQRQFYEEQIEQLKTDKNDLKKELDTVRTVLKELHEQTSNQQTHEQDRMNNLQLKEDLLAKDASLFQAQSTIAGLRKELEQTREEMLTLQETVHKECAEREQLKDALIEARQQLLAMKKNGVLNGTASRSLHSPPVAFEEIERRVSGPLQYSHTSSQQQFSSNHSRQRPSVAPSESSTRDGSLPGDNADLIARPMSAAYTVPYRHKALPPIQPQPQQHRRNGSVPSSNKTDQLLENQRRIARFIKHIK